MRSCPDKSRATIYRTLAALFQCGLSEGMVGPLQAVDEIAAVLPHTINDDELAADHHALFDFNVFPYQSIFLDASGLLGGVETDRVLRCYQNAGLDASLGWVATADSPDHIAYELAFLSALIEQESWSQQSAKSFDSRRFRGLQAQFLRDHLLRWISPFVIALQTQEHPFYSALSKWTLRTVFAHAADLEDSVVDHVALVDSPDSELALLDSEETGLLQIASYLLIPLRSGIYLSKQDISNIARRLELPRGFGDRQEMFLNLLRAAVSYDRLAELISDVKNLVEVWLEMYAGHIELSAACAPSVKFWTARARRTLKLLDRLAELSFQSPI